MDADTILHKVIETISSKGVPDEYFDTYCELAERALAIIQDTDNHHDHCALVARLMLTMSLNLNGQGTQPLFSLN
jgi:hypothetical protein